MNDAPLLRTAQAAARLGIHPQTLRAWVRDGRLKCVRINERGDRRFQQADLDAYLAAKPRARDPQRKEQA